MGFQSIAIDGPAGAGKSTLARRLAGALGFLYVDTGAIYRTLGLFALRSGVDPADPAAMEALLPRVSLRIDYGPDGGQHMFLGQEDVTQAIRLPEVSRASSAVSAIPAVRAYLLEMQRGLAGSRNVVMDGRDIGTVVLPQADVKVFLTASPEARAQRRYAELSARGTPQDYAAVLADMIERDRKDTTRAAAPLRQAEDAVLVDTTHLDLEESFHALLDAVKRELKA